MFLNNPYFVVQNGIGQAILRNAVPEHSAQFGERFKNRYFVSEQREVVRTGQSCGSAADDERVRGADDRGEALDADLRDRVVKALIEKNEIEVPETMVERQLDMMLESTKRRLANQKLSLAVMGLDDESYKVQFKSVAEQQVKGSLLLDALSGQEKITVGEADVEARLKKIAEENGQPFERIDAFYKQNQQTMDNLVAQVKEDRVVEFLLDKATVSEVDKSEI